MESLANATNKYNVSFRKKKGMGSFVPFIVKDEEGKENRKKINRKVRGDKYTVHCSQPKINNLLSRKLKTITADPIEDQPEKEEKIKFNEDNLKSDEKDIETR